MELRQIRYFKEVADARSFAKGAYKLRVAQPALSRSVAGLEDEIGQMLFVRHTGGVTLTEVGTRFYQHAVDLLQRVQSLSDEMAAGADDPHGTISLGVPPSMQSTLTAPVVASFLKKYPRVSVNVIQDTSVNLRAAITSGALDLAITSTLMASSGVRYTPLYTEAVCLVERAESPPLFSAPVVIRDLTGLPLMLCGYPNTVRLLLERAFADADEKIDFRCEVNTSSLLFDLVNEGAGVGIAPSCAMSSRKASEFRLTPIKGLEFSWTIATSLDRVESAATKQLITMLTDHVEHAIKSGNWPTARFDWEP